MFLCLNIHYTQTNSPSIKTQNSTKQMLLEATNLLADVQSVQNLRAAKMLLKKILTIDSRNTVAHTLTGVIADRENDLQTAEKHFALAAQLAPRSPETLNNYGAILLKLNRKTEAAKKFNVSLVINPSQQSALINLANILFDTGNLEDARKLFERAKEISPDEDILRALLLISLQLNKKADASKYFKDYLPTLKSSTVVGSQKLQTDLCSALLANNMFVEAQQYLELIVANNGNNVEALILLSRAYLGQKNIVAAGRTLESAIARGMTDAKLYLALSEVYQSGGYLENAIPAMRLAIEKDPKNEFYLARYGLLLIDAKAPAAAVIRLKEAVTEMPNSARLWLALGTAQLVEGGKVVDAQESFEHILKLEPRSIPALAYLGTIYTERADYAEAANTYKRALAIEESNALLHYLLADTLLKMPESDQNLIESHLRRAVALDAKLASAHFALGKVYARAERWNDAVNEFQRTVDNAPELAEAHYQLGRALTRLKQTAAANLEFEQYKKLNETQSAQKETDRRELVRRLANVKF